METSGCCGNGPKGPVKAKERRKKKVIAQSNFPKNKLLMPSPHFEYKNLFLKVSQMHQHYIIIIIYHI